ncbi:MAG: hypothetical protein IT578_08190 [Verrucomicrobiae bacterium]|nr:hypothetical protein [Verrucomicrobiae bacterium]
MRNRFTRNFGLKIVSVLLAAIVWWIMQVRSGALRDDPPPDEVPSGPLQ